MNPNFMKDLESVMKSLTRDDFVIFTRELAQALPDDEQGAFLQRLWNAHVLQIKKKQELEKAREAEREAAEKAFLEAFPLHCREEMEDILGHLSDIQRGRILLPAVCDPASYYDDVPMFITCTSNEIGTELERAAAFLHTCVCTGCFQEALTTAETLLETSVKIDDEYYYNSGYEDLSLRDMQDEGFARLDLPQTGKDALYAAYCAGDPDDREKRTAAMAELLQTAGITGISLEDALKAYGAAGEQAAP